MKPLIYSLALMPCLLAAAPAAAQVTGAWHVTGQINGKSFAADCNFAPAAAGFGGVCIDESNGKQHVLSTGTTAGSQVQWSYQTSFMMKTFSVTFAGTLSNGGMAGTVTAANRKGAFTATRKQG